MARPSPIRQAVMDLFKSKMQSITLANGYLFDVGAARVHMVDMINATVTTPSISIVQRTEGVKWANVNAHYERDLIFQVGFVDEYGGDDPDAQAVLFMTEIQRAVRFREEFITVTDRDTGLVTARHPVAFYETGNVMNLGEPLEGRVFGQIDYTVNYFTSSDDPREL